MVILMLICLIIVLTLGMTRRYCTQVRGEMYQRYKYIEYDGPERRSGQAFDFKKRKVQ